MHPGPHSYLSVSQKQLKIIKAKSEPLIFLFRNYSSPNYSFVKVKKSMTLILLT